MRRALVVLLLLLASIHLVASLYQDAQNTINLQQVGAATEIKFPTMDSASKYLYWIQQDGRTKDGMAWLYKKDLQTQIASSGKSLPFSLASVRFLNMDDTNAYVGYWKKRAEWEQFGDLVLVKISSTGVTSSVTIVGDSAYKSNKQVVSAVIGDDNIMYIASMTLSVYSLTITAVNMASMTVLKTSIIYYDGSKPLDSVTTHFAKGVLFVRFQDALVSMSGYPTMSQIRQLKPADISVSLLDASSPSSPVLYAVNKAGTALNKIDLNTMMTTKTLFFTFAGAKWLALNPADTNKMLYVYSGNTLIRVRTTDLIQVESAVVTSYPGSIRGFEISRAKGYPFLYLISSQQSAYTVNQGCQPGTYINSGYCSPCQPGTFSMYNNMNSCERCSPGKYQPTSGATYCYSCYAGTYTDKYGSAQCTSCEPGTYAFDTGASACKDCSPGTYASTYGNTNCKSCSAGTYAEAYSSTKCDSCWDGSVSKYGASTCTNCTAGYYSDTTNMLCLTCTPGTFSTAGSSSCTNCPIGTYSRYSGSKSCLPCASATTRGQSYCSDQSSWYFPFFSLPVIIGFATLVACCCCLCLCCCSCAGKRSSTTTTVTKPPTAVVVRPAAQAPRPPVAPAQYYQSGQTHSFYQAAAYAQQPVQYYQQPSVYTKGGYPVYHQQPNETQPVMYSNSLAQQQYPIYHQLE